MDNITPEDEEDMAAAFYEQQMNPRDYQPERWTAEAIQAAAESISDGMKWFGFWLAVGLAMFGGLAK